MRGVRKDGKRRAYHARKPINKEGVFSEEVEQINVVNRLKAKMEQGDVVTYTSIPNSTRTKFYIVLHGLYAQGLRHGLPDLFIIYRNRSGEQKSVFVEMKRVSGSTTSAAQKERIAHINATVGLKAIVCKGAAKAIEALQNLMDE